MPEAAKGGVSDTTTAHGRSSTYAHRTSRPPRPISEIVLTLAASAVLAGCGSSGAETQAASEAQATTTAGPAPSMIKGGGLDLEREWFTLAKGESGPVCSPARYLTEGFGAKSDGNPDAVARKLGLSRHDITADYGVAGDGALIVIRGADTCWMIAQAAISHGEFAAP